MDLTEIKNFMKSNGYCISYKYKNNSGFFLNRNNEHIEKNINSHNCKSVRWFNNIKTKKFLNFTKKRFSEYINSNNFKITNISNFKNKLVNNNIIKDNTVILGPCEVLYPFIINKFKTLAIPNSIYSENINTYFIRCITYKMLFNNCDIYICFSKNIEKVNNIKKNGNIRYVTKEVYTIYEFLKLYENDKNLNKKIKVKQINNGFKLFNLWKIYSINI